MENIVLCKIVKGNVVVMKIAMDLKNASFPQVNMTVFSVLK